MLSRILCVLTMAESVNSSEYRVLSIVLNLFWNQLYKKFKFKYVKNKMCSKHIWPEFRILFLALNNINFLRVLGKSLRNNALPTILRSTPPSYFLQYHLRYSLKYVTHATHTSISPTVPTLTHSLCHPHWYVILARQPRHTR